MIKNKNKGKKKIPKTTTWNKAYLKKHVTDDVCTRHQALWEDIAFGSYFSITGKHLYSSVIFETQIDLVIHTVLIPKDANHKWHVLPQFNIARE